MIKSKIRKSLSVLLSVTMMASMLTSFAAVASAEENASAEPTATGVQTFTEDFSSYTSDKVSTSYVSMYDDTAGTVAATHPSGAKWKIPQSSAARGRIGNYAGSYLFELNESNPTGNFMKIRGMNTYTRASLNLDISEAFNVKKFEKFEFITVAANESIGTRLFVNEAEDTYLEFAVAGGRTTATEGGTVPQHMPKVVYSNAGTRTVLFNAGEEITLDDTTTTTRGAQDGWKGDKGAKHVKWTITVNDDNSLTWTATTLEGGSYKAGEATSTGTISAEIAAPLIENYKYPLAATGDGDDQYGYYSQVSFDYIPDNSVVFTEDFSSYTAETVSTTDVSMLDGTAGNVAATHPSGAKWKVPQSRAARGCMNEKYAGKYRFDINASNPTGSTLSIRGMNTYTRGSLNLDISEAFNVKKFEKFEFVTVAANESIGTRLFVNEAEDTYLEFAVAGGRTTATEGGTVPQHMPKVVYSNAGTRTVLFNAGEEITLDDVTTTTRGAQDGWKGDKGAKHVKWTITVNDDNSLTWTVTTSEGGSYKAGEATSTGTISAEIAAPLMKNYRYPLAATGDGDDQYGSYHNVSFAYIPDNTLTFTEDFSSYTADSVATDHTKVTDKEAEMAIATHPSGAQWKVPKTSQARGNGNSWYKFDVTDNNLHLHGYWDHYRSSMNLDTSKVGIDKINEFSFNVTSIYETGGVRLFVSDDENSYIEFSVPGGRPAGTENGTVPADMPKVVYVNNGERNILFNSGATVQGDDGNDTTQGLKDGWKATANRWQKKQVKWDIVVNDDNSLTWTATSTGGIYTAGEAVSTGTISAEIAAPLIKNYRYPLAFTADGDNGDNNSYISNVSFKYEKDKDFKAPTFSDDFSGYVADENTVTESFKIQDNRKVLATHSSGAKWITSNKNSYSTYPNYAGRAYVDIEKNKLATVGWGTWHVQRVLLDYSAEKYDIDKVKFSTDIGDGRMIGLSMFVDGKNEDNYLFFGQMSGESDVFGIKDTNQPYAPVIVKSVNGEKTVLQMTEKTSGSEWNITDKQVDWTIEFDENHNIKWTATSSRGTMASGTINADDDIKTLIEANWAYPLAATATGDAFSYITSVDMWTSNTRKVVYDKKAYTRDEFKALYEKAEYGRTEEVEKLMKLDLSDVDGGTATAEVNVGTTSKIITPAFLGTHTEYNTGYEGLADSDGNLTEEFKQAAESMTPIAAYRIGGGGTTSKNMLNDLRDQDSYYLAANYLPDHMKDNAGTVSHTHTAVDFVTLINAALANNPDASFNLCISPYTTTPEEVAELISLLTGTDSAARRSYGLPEKALNVDYIELGNELEHFSDYAKSEEFSVWYGNRMPAYISAIEAVAPSVKIIANGMTCPWGDENYYDFWLDMIAATRTVDGDSSYRIIDHIDSISFHPYNSLGHGSPSYVLEKGDNMKAYLDRVAPGNNVKFCVTEYGTNWRDRGTSFGGKETYSLKGALMNATFLLEATQNDSIDLSAMFAHCTMGSLWPRIWNNFVTPLGDMYSLLADEWLNNVYDTDVTVTDEDGVVGSYDNQFTVVAMKNSGNTMKFVITNAADYKSVETKFNIPSGYTLVNEKIFTAPNVYSSIYNENCANITTVTSNDVEVENFSTYTVPSKSIVVLTLKAADGKSELAENFDYANTELTASDSEEKTVASNSNGAVWKTSKTNNGLTEADDETLMDPVYGTVSINGKALVIKNDYAENDNGDASKATSANWDISAMTDKPAGISEISFTINGENGGVKLFADADESSKFDFSNKTVALSGSVNWTIKIADGTLTYTASNGGNDKTGTMAMTDEDMTGYTYLVSAYLNGGVADSITFDNFLFRYGSTAAPELKAVTVTNNTSTVDVTVNPSVLNKTSVRVLVGYYNGDTLVGANTAVITADGQIFNSAKPSATYTKAKVFVWDSNSQTPLTDETEVN